MMKIGISTIYYNNDNYGANLQAYALCKVFDSMGVKVEVINYCSFSPLHKFLSDIKTLLIYAGKNNFIKRKKAIKKFRNSIPHSKLYYPSTLDKCCDRYDCFVVGSDQVWNPDNLDNRYYNLSFVKKGTRKYSYAASIGKSTLTVEQLKKYETHLLNYNGIGVREADGVTLLKQIKRLNPILTLDPTLLLSDKDWESIMAPIIINQKYIFCYFLNDDCKNREIAKEFALRHNLKIVTLPFLSYKYRDCDDGFGDYTLFDVTPNNLLFLIKNSEYVFCDSFHIAVFSHIFKKQFFAFDDFKSATGSRLSTLTSIFKTENRFINNQSKMNIEYIESLSDIDYANGFDDYLNIKEKSISYIKEIAGLKK